MDDFILRWEAPPQPERKPGDEDEEFFGEEDLAGVAGEGDAPGTVGAAGFGEAGGEGVSGARGGEQRGAPPKGEQQSPSPSPGGMSVDGGSADLQ